MDDTTEPTPAAETTPADSTPADTARARDILAAHRRAPREPESIDDTPSPEAPSSDDAPAPRRNVGGRPRGSKTKKRRPASKRELRDEVKRLRALQPPAPRSTSAAIEPEAARSSTTETATRDPELRAKAAAGIGKFAGTILGLVAYRRGAHWSLSETEKLVFGEASVDAIACVEELLPAFAPYIAMAERLVPLGVFAGVTFELAQSRLEIDAKIERGEAQRVIPLPTKPIPEAKSLQLVETAPRATS